jgi:hypothetical protein
MDAAFLEIGTELASSLFGLADRGDGCGNFQGPGPVSSYPAKARTVLRSSRSK